VLPYQGGSFIHSFTEETLHVFFDRRKVLLYFEFIKVGPKAMDPRAYTGLVSIRSNQFALRVQDFDFHSISISTWARGPKGQNTKSV